MHIPYLFIPKKKRIKLNTPDMCVVGYFTRILQKNLTFQLTQQKTPTIKKPNLKLQG